MMPTEEKQPIPTNKHYTVEKHTQILISLLKQYGLRKLLRVQELQISL